MAFLGNSLGSSRVRLLEVGTACTAQGLPYEVAPVCGLGLATVAGPQQVGSLRMLAGDVGRMPEEVSRG